MATPVVDRNQWYQIYNNGDKSQAVMGTNLFNRGGTTGAVFFNTTNTAANVQRWQIFPVTVNDTKLYTLRCKEGGPNAFMSTFYVEAEATDGKTRPIMMRGDVANKNAYWSIEAWGDDTWFFTNAANGSGYHLNKNGNGIMVMSSDIAAPQNGQRFQFATIDKIDDDKYSSVNLVGMTSSSSRALSSSTTASNTATSNSVVATSTSGSSSSTPSPDPIANSSTSSGLSTGAKAAIGAVVGGVVLIALVILGLYLRKKRKHRAQYTKAYELPQGSSDQHLTPVTKYEMNHDGAAKYEMPTTYVVEVPNSERPAELPGCGRDMHARTT
ncbi:hypothetical protein FB567DRAFT_256283 [Paraphoma chrysanthemicola]|uniref:Ricin B lectin domain-containing protein n=1 Tax=Paraphoma chrysanthemicola TaxID=798071 RepID=A0A8K0QT46_9PLEO|nr:hypothetical protein FB567DRAFT_256283 [Paraphoma chrysanthemicola]